MNQHTEAATDQRADEEGEVYVYVTATVEECRAALLRDHADFTEEEAKAAHRFFVKLRAATEQTERVAKRQGQYVLCRCCDHFVEPRPCPKAGAAEWIHLDDGDKEHDHDALPGVASMTLAEWQRERPDLFTEYADGKIGPNSVHYAATKGE